MFRSPHGFDFPLAPASRFGRNSDLIETLLATEVSNDNAPLGIPARVRQIAEAALAAARDAKAN